MSLGGGPDPGRLQGGYDAGYAGYSNNPGLDPNSIPWEQSDLGMANKQGYMAAAAANNVVEPDFSFLEGFGQSTADMMARFDAQTAENNARYEAQLAEAARVAEENRLAQGRADRDTAYGSYLDAAGTATDFINSQIKAEQSNARLIGVDYAPLTDEMKSNRINNYFATLWGEGDQTSLDKLMGEFGSPDGFEGYSVTRGDASEFKGVSGEESVSQSGGIKPKKKTPLTDDEDTLGGETTILGA